MFSTQVRVDARTNAPRRQVIGNKLYLFEVFTKQILYIYIYNLTSLRCHDKYTRLDKICRLSLECAH